MKSFGLFAILACLNLEGMESNDPLALLTEAAQIFSVDFNSSGTGLLGGLDNGLYAYAALVAPDGTLTKLSGMAFPSIGVINSVAINEIGAGIIGGRAGEPAYAALVAPDGTLTKLSGPAFPSLNGEILSVAINETGIGIIGGQDLTGSHPAYASFVMLDGTLKNITGASFPSTNGAIYNVAINDRGIGILGGIDGNSAYAALVAPDGSLTKLSGTAFPSVNGEILSVAINETGTGIIGGQDLMGEQPAYAALVEPDGTLKDLSGDTFPSTTGAIHSVAINETGAGIIGGQDLTGNQPAYAALVEPDGTLKDLTGDSFPSINGTIHNVAIADSGVALIEGRDFTESPPVYAALVAPDGTLTELKGLSFPSPSATVLSIFLDGFGEAVTPQSIGPYSAVANTQLAASYAMTAHLGAQKFKTKKSSPPETALVAAAKNPPPCNSQKPLLYTIWFAPFGNYVHQDANGAIPLTINKVVGALLGLEYHPSHFLVGASFGYAYNFLRYGQSLGDGHVQEEMACLYTAYESPHFYFNATLWGGIYQIHNKRHSAFELVTSIAHIRGWVVSPHAELAFPISLANQPWCIFQPFAMADWVNNWQNHFTEEGAASLNLSLGDQYNSLLRSEVGLRFDQKLRGGQLLLEEKLSYVNQTPFHFNNTTTFFAGSASTFPIAIGSTKSENLAVGEFRIAYTARRGMVLLDLQAEFNNSYQSYFTGLEFDIHF